jgi:hypothetical protein
MLSKIWLINVVLLFLVGFFGLKAYGVWVQGNAGDNPPQIGRKLVQKSPKPVATPYDRKIAPETKYDALITLNLFSPERKETILETPKPDAKAKKLSASEQKNNNQYFTKLTLYGLVITNDSAEALVSYPVAKPVLTGRKSKSRNVKRLTARQTKWVKVGDTLGDFKVVSITPDRVLLKIGDQSFDLLLYDKGKLKKRAAAKPKTGPNVVGVSVKPEAVSQVTGVAQKPGVASQVRKSSAKSPALNANRTSNLPLPVKKGNSDAVVPKNR